MENILGIFSTGINCEVLFLHFSSRERLDVLCDLSEELLGLLAKVFFATLDMVLSIWSLVKALLRAESVGHLGPG